jgi:NitT/TauT family transport system substrate-binding protein
LSPEKILMFRLLGGLAALASLFLSPCANAGELEKIILLEPAPVDTWALAPFILAKSKGYYADEGLAVTFQSANGGADVAKQVGAGNADIGTALGDTPIIVRQNGVPIRGVALMGGHAVHQLILRADRHIDKLEDLKGKKLAVSSFQDTSFYVTQAIISTAHLQRSDVGIEAVGVIGSFQVTANGATDGMVGAPESGLMIEATGVKIIDTPSDEFFPGLGQAILASDDVIAKRPAMIKHFVAATLHAISDIVKDPDAETNNFVQAVPAVAPKQAMIQATLNFYAKRVYPFDSGKVGAFDPARVAKLQDFYLSQNIIRAATPVDQLFTNDLIP